MMGLRILVDWFWLIVVDIGWSSWTTGYASLLGRDGSVLLQVAWASLFSITSLGTATWRSAASYAGPPGGNPTSGGPPVIWPGGRKPAASAFARWGLLGCATCHVSKATLNPVKFDILRCGARGTFGRCQRQSRTTSRFSP